MFNEIKGDKNFQWREAIGSLTFGTKEDFPALQAADMLAYWFYKAERRGHKRYVSYFESELRKAGITILDHLILPDDLKNMRQNFLREHKKSIFGKAELDNTSEEIESTSLSVPGYVQHRY